MSTTQQPIQRVVEICDAQVETPAEDGMIRRAVRWRLDNLPWQGLLHVRMDAGTEDRGIIAELCALDWLMRTRRIFGNEVAPDKSVVLVSYGAIKKLVRQDTAKEHLIPYGRRAYFQLQNSDLDVSKGRAWINEVEIREEWRVDAVPPPPITLDFYGIGPVVIKRHAMERYMERVQTVSMHRTLESMKKRVSQRLVPVARSEQHKAKKAMKHGLEATPYLHPLSDTVFVVGDDRYEGKVLLTVFKSLGP